MKLPPKPPHSASLHKTTSTTAASTSGVPLNCGRRLVNWSTLRSLLVDFVSPRLRFATDIPKTNEGNVVDLGPSLIDGKIILALLHHASPKTCPYDPFPEDWATSSSNSPTAATNQSNKSKKQSEELDQFTMKPDKRKDLTCEQVETIRRTAFTRANVLFGCPPILSDGNFYISIFLALSLSPISYIE